VHADALGDGLAEEGVEGAHEAGLAHQFFDFLAAR
jgi:hypothetical protein